MNKFTEEDIDNFFKQMVYIFNDDDDDNTSYKTFASETYTKIQAVHYRKEEKHYIIFAKEDNSYDIIHEDNPLHDRLFEHAVEFKMTRGGEYKIHFDIETINVTAKSRKLKGIWISEIK